MPLSNYLDKNLITFLEETSRDEAILALVELAYKQGKLQDKNLFYEAIIKRENIVSTGIGMSIAIPHAKISGLKDFFIVIGILNKGLEWNSLDGAPVRCVFLIGGPENKQTEYLKILSSLTQAIKEDNIRKKILNIKSVDALMNFWSTYGS